MYGLHNTLTNTLTEGDSAGHLVSGYVKQHLPIMLVNHLSMEADASKALTKGMLSLWLVINPGLLAAKQSRPLTAVCFLVQGLLSMSVVTVPTPTVLPEVCWLRAHLPTKGFTPTSLAHPHYATFRQSFTTGLLDWLGCRLHTAWQQKC